MMEEIWGRAEAALSLDGGMYPLSRDKVITGIVRHDIPALLSSLQAAQARVGVLEKALRDIKSACEDTTGHPWAALDGIDTTARQALSEGGGT